MRADEGKVAKVALFDHVARHDDGVDGSLLRGQDCLHLEVDASNVLHLVDRISSWAAGGGRVDPKIVDIDEAGRGREVVGALRQDEDSELPVLIGLDLSGATMPTI